VFKIDDEVQVITPDYKDKHPDSFRYMWCGVIKKIIPTFETITFCVKFDYTEELETFYINELRLHNALTREEIIGRWLWCDNHKIFVEKKAEEKNFYIIHEPGSPFAPRPVHFDGIKYGKIIDESYNGTKVTGEKGTINHAFCSCCAYKLGKEYAEVEFETFVNRWDLEKAIKPIEELLKKKNVKIETASVLGRTSIKFIDMDNSSCTKKDDPRKTALPRVLEEKPKPSSWWWWLYGKVK
jgi:hypothetical protein